MNPKILGAFVAGVAATAAGFYLGSTRTAAPPAVIVSAPRAPAPVATPEPQKQAAPPEAPKTSEPVATVVPEPVRRASQDRERPRRAAAPIAERWRSERRPPVELPAVASKAVARVAEEPPPAPQPVPRPAEPPRPVEVARVSDPPKQVERERPAPLERPVGVEHPVEVAHNDPRPRMSTSTPPAPADFPPPPPEPRKVTIIGGTLLVVRIIDTVSSEKNQTGDTFTATLDQPIIVEGLVIAERGAHVEGRVAEAERARVKGTSRLQLELTRFTSSDGQVVGIRTAAVEKESTNSTKSDVAKVGIGAAAGAVLGGIFGGGKGAGIGAAAGGAAGGGVAVATRGKPIEVPAESRLTFRINDPVVITEKVNH